MSRSGKVSLAFDQARDFRLGIGQLEELQERTDAGPEELFSRIGAGRWRVADIQQTLRLGLIGAGATATEAAVLVERYAGSGQLVEWKDHCRAILYAAIAGAPDEDDPSGETTGEKAGSPDQKSGSARSTSSEPVSASLQTNSVKCPSGISTKRPLAGSGPTASKKKPKPRAKKSSKRP